MLGDEILLLGIAVQPPWQLVDQHLDTEVDPNFRTKSEVKIRRLSSALEKEPSPCPETEVNYSVPTSRRELPLRPQKGTRPRARSPRVSGSPGPDQPVVTTAAQPV